MLLLYHYIATVLFFLWLYTQFFVAIYTVFCGYIIRERIVITVFITAQKNKRLKYKR